MTLIEGAAATLPVDGRRARRERGREAATDAVIDLVLEGHAPPTTEQVAERAGVSVATLFRYFETLDDLRRQAIARYFERCADLFEIPGIGMGDLDARITGCVAARVAQHEATAPMARLARSRALTVAEIDTTLHEVRAMQNDQVRMQFADELEARTPAERADLVATISVVTSFEAWDQYCHDHGRTAAQIRRAWSVALAALLRSD